MPVDSAIYMYNRGKNHRLTRLIPLPSGSYVDNNPSRLFPPGNRDNSVFGGWFLSCQGGKTPGCCNILPVSRAYRHDHLRKTCNGIGAHNESTVAGCICYMAYVTSPTVGSRHVNGITISTFAHPIVNVQARIP